MADTGGAGAHSESGSPTLGGGGGGGGGVNGGGGGGSGGVLFTSSAGGGGGGGGTSKVPAGGTVTAASLGAKPQIVITWTIPSPISAPGATQPISAPGATQPIAAPGATHPTVITKHELTRAEKLTAALHVCAKLRSKRKRRACVATARRRYGHHKPKKHKTKHH